MRIKAGLLAAVSAVLLGAVGVASAQNIPGDQGLTSVDKNLAKDPDSRGLQNAQKRIQDNQKDRATRKSAKRDHDDKGKRDRPERAEHPDHGGRT